jgi:hypothetical protein
MQYGRRDDILKRSAAFDSSGITNLRRNSKGRQRRSLAKGDRWPGCQPFQGSSWQDHWTGTLIERLIHHEWLVSRYEGS